MHYSRNIVNGPRSDN